MKINKAHQSLDTCINRKVVVVPPYENTQKQMYETNEARTYT